MIRLSYNGVDITEQVSINRCWHDMYASGQSDTLQIRLNDAESIWDQWSPAVGDEIRVDFDTISTGAMFIARVIPRNGTYDIMAQSAPASGFEIQNKAWQKIRLLQLGEQIAKRNGLSFVSYGVEDKLYSYIQQTEESDFVFLNRRARLEGCAFLVYNKTLVLYSESYMEAIAPSETLIVGSDGEYQYNDRGFGMYGSCIVEGGMYSGEFVAGSGRKYRATNVGNIGSSQEAQRFAKNLLRYVNKNCYSGFVRAHILPGYAAASTVTLSNERATSWNGTVFLDHIRNDYGAGKSKIFFRRLLEGY